MTYMCVILKKYKYIHTYNKKNLLNDMTTINISKCKINGNCFQIMHSRKKKKRNLLVNALCAWAIRTHHQM